MAQNESKEISTKSPFAGCTIVIVGICTMIFLVVFVVWNLFKLDSEIEKFTTDTAVDTPVPELIDHAAAFNAFKAKLEIFKDAVGKEEDADLSLTPEEINIAIAAHDEFKDLRKTFSITSIEDDKLHIQISFPLRGKPMSGTMRYLNGTMIATPTLSGDEIVLTIEKIIVPDTVVPEGFIGQMSPYRLTQRYMEDETLGPWMKKLSGLSVADGTVVLSYVHQDAVAQEAPKNMSPFVNRALLLFACFVLVFVVALTAVVTISRRRKAMDSDSDS